MIAVPMDVASANEAVPMSVDGSDALVRMELGCDYSPVISGVTNVATGTFKFAEKNKTFTVPLDYSGNGYPISVMIFPTDGVLNQESPARTRVERYGIIYYVMAKMCMTGDNAEPSYSGDGINNGAHMLYYYKSSSTSYTSASTTNASSYTLYSTQSAEKNSYNFVRFNSNKQMSIATVGTSTYGFMEGIEYRYVICYSS